MQAAPGVDDEEAERVFLEAAPDGGEAVVHADVAERFGAHDAHGDAALFSVAGEGDVFDDALGYGGVTSNQVIDIVTKHHLVTKRISHKCLRRNALRGPAALLVAKWCIGAMGLSY